MTLSAVAVYLTSVTLCHNGFGYTAAATQAHVGLVVRWADSKENGTEHLVASQ